MLALLALSLAAATPGLLIRQDGALRIRVEDESAKPLG